VVTSFRGVVTGRSGAETRSDDAAPGVFGMVKGFHGVVGGNCDAAKETKPTVSAPQP
jgi:hypothetical protein